MSIFRNKWSKLYNDKKIFLHLLSILYLCYYVDCTKFIKFYVSSKMIFGSQKPFYMGETSKTSKRIQKRCIFSKKVVCRITVVKRVPRMFFILQLNESVIIFFSFNCYVLKKLQRQFARTHNLNL